MPRDYKHKLGGYFFNYNLDLVKKAFAQTHQLLEKYRESRNKHYQYLESLADDTNSELQIIKAWLRKFPNFSVARDAATELGRIQNNFNGSIKALQMQLFLEGDLTETTLAAINEAVTALAENDKIVQANLDNNEDIPPYLDKALIETLVTKILIELTTNQLPPDQD